MVGKHLHYRWLVGLLASLPAMLVGVKSGDFKGRSLSGCDKWPFYSATVGVLGYRCML
jgi:hypothetical protein